MFRSSTILRELVQSLAKVTFLLKHLAKLRYCILCGDVAACRKTVCVLFVVQTSLWYNANTMLPAGRPATSCVHYTTSCVCMCSLLNEALKDWDSRPIASNVGVKVKKELERVWREAVVAYLCHVISLYITINQQDAAVCSQFYFTAGSLHVSGAFHTHHQEYIKLYLQPPVQVILSLQLPSSNVAKFGLDVYRRV